MFDLLSQYIADMTSCECVYVCVCPWLICLHKTVIQNDTSSNKSMSKQNYRVANCISMPERPIPHTCRSNRYGKIFSYFILTPNVSCSTHSGEFHLGYNKSQMKNLSWYDIVHWENLSDAQSKHRLSMLNNVKHKHESIF